jgi:hypothetical protein
MNSENKNERDKDIETSYINSFEGARDSSHIFEVRKSGDPSMRVPLIEEYKENNYLPKTKVFPTEGEQ